MSQIFRIKRGDTSPSIRVALEPSSISLIGADCVFQMRQRRGAMVISAPGVIESTSPPIVRYDWGPADTATAGNYEAEFLVTYADGSRETFPNSGFIQIPITEDVR